FNSLLQNLPDHVTQNIANYKAQQGIFHGSASSWSPTTEALSEQSRNRTQHSKQLFQNQINFENQQQNQVTEHVYTNYIFPKFKQLTSNNQWSASVTPSKPSSISTADNLNHLGKTPANFANKNNFAKWSATQLTSA